MNTLRVECFAVLCPKGVHFISVQSRAKTPNSNKKPHTQTHFIGWGAFAVSLISMVIQMIATAMSSIDVLNRL